MAELRVPSCVFCVFRWPRWAGELEGGGAGGLIFVFCVSRWARWAGALGKVEELEAPSGRRGEPWGRSRLQRRSCILGRCPFLLTSNELIVMSAHV